MYFFIFAYIFSQDFSDQVLTVEPTAECFCFHMISTSFDSDKFGWFGGAGVSSFIFHRKESCQICRCCQQLSISALFAKFCIREIHMSELNVMCSPDFSDHVLNSRALDEDASLICLCFQALAYALKTNSSVTDIDLRENKIGAEGAKAWCVGLALQNR